MPPKKNQKKGKKGGDDDEEFWYVYPETRCHWVLTDQGTKRSSTRFARSRNSGG